MLKFYKEKNGDFLSHDGTFHYSSGEKMLEVRAAALEGNSFSVQGTSMSIGYRKTCKRVKFEDMPIKWQNALKGE
jgi:hypothetical protein